MADSEANQTTEPLARSTEGGEKPHLKHLEFVQSAVIYFLVCFSTVYEYARENSGPLKPGVQTVENTVKTVIGPVYERFQDVPFEVLKFVDAKVDDALKQAPSQAKFKELALEGVKMASRTAHSVYKKYEPTAKELYASYEPVAEKYAVTAWREMNKLPLFPQLAQVAVPTAAFAAAKYNVVVCYTAEKGYPVAQYLPLIPIEKIAKVFEDENAAQPAGQSGQSGHNAQSNQVVT